MWDIIAFKCELNNMLSWFIRLSLTFFPFFYLKYPIWNNILLSPISFLYSSIKISHN